LATDETRIGFRVLEIPARIFDDLPRRLTLGVEFPVPPRIRVGGIDDGTFKKSMIHD